MEKIKQKNWLNGKNRKWLNGKLVHSIKEKNGKWKIG